MTCYIERPPVEMEVDLSVREGTNRLRSVFTRHFSQFARRSDIDNLYVQVAAMLALDHATGGAVSLQGLRGWAISPDALSHIVSDILRRGSPKVIEFGCGESTLVIGHVLRRLGSGALTSIEHDINFAAEVEQRIASSKLEATVVAMHVPLAQYPRRAEFNSCESYDLTNISAQFDIAVVDGPITSKHGAATRLVPLEWCLARLSPGGSVYLDDANRSEEQQLVKYVEMNWGDVRIDRIATEKGLARFTRPTHQNSGTIG